MATTFRCCVAFLSFFVAACTHPATTPVESPVSQTTTNGPSADPDAATATASAAVDVQVASDDAASADGATTPSTRADRDHDGIPDDEDQCPEQPGIPQMDRPGCPPRVMVCTDCGMRMPTVIVFEARSARIAASQQATLDNLRQVLQDHPEIEEVVLYGHADPGTDGRDPNRIGLLRAQSVRQFLVGHGIQPQRLVARSEGVNLPPGVVVPTSPASARRVVRFEVTRPPQVQK